MQSSATIQPTVDPPVSVLIVDDHPALRAGLTGLLEQEPGFASLGAVSSEQELGKALTRHAPDVVILDYALGRSDGLSACFRIKQRARPRGVVLYSAYVDDAFAVPAALAQADAIVQKTAPVDVLLDAVRAVARGRSEPLRPSPEFIEAASAGLIDADLPVVGMLLSRVSVDDIASTLGVAPDSVRAQALRIIGQMQAADRFADSTRAIGREPAFG